MRNTFCRLTLALGFSCSLFAQAEHARPTIPSPKAASFQAHRPPDSWRRIFDGKNMDGWEMVGPGEFKQQINRIVTYGGMGMLWYTKEKFGNCQIRVTFKTSQKNDNSGVFIRIPEPPKNPWDAVNKGYEVQIAASDDDYHTYGCLYSISKAVNRVTIKPGEWNTYLITLDGDRTRVEVNGKLVTDFKEGNSVPTKAKWYEPARGTRPQAGYIGLQNHDYTTKVIFKEVAVRPLPSN